jgi:hypothetical protein
LSKQGVALGLGLGLGLGLAIVLNIPVIVQSIQILDQDFSPGRPKVGFA